MARPLPLAWMVTAGLLLLAWPAQAQVKLGELSNNLSGTVSTGYTDNWSTLDPSDHSWTVGGSGTLSGFYYNPNFVSYTLSPYLNQSRANSDFQSISDASGLNFTSSIFSGSRFPGFVSYSKAYNSEGNFAIPGLANFTTHGDSDNVGINWNEMLPDAPSLSVGYQQGSNQYSLYGTNDEGNSSFRTFNVHSGYTLLGFNMAGYYSLGQGNSVIPQIADIQEETQTHSNDSDYGFTLGHVLPLRGSFSAGINRADVSSNYLGTNDNATIDTINTSANIQPTNKLHFSFGADYSDNLSGQLFQSVIAAGGVVPGFNANEESHSMDFIGTASYSLMSNLQTSVFGERRQQYFLGENYGANSYGGGVTYGRTLLGGNFNTSLTLSDNTVDKSNLNALGFATTTNYTRQIFGWLTTGSFSYSQNVQTLLITYMTSFYNYSGSTRHRWGKVTTSAGASAGRTALTEFAGTQNSSESFNASFGYSRWITLTGTYGKANGNALQTGSGLTIVPIPSPLLPPSDLILFGGKNYAFGLGSSPAKKLTIMASYARSRNNTFVDLLASNNHNGSANLLIQYNFRKMYFTSGYSRLEQSFSLSGLPPQMVSSFYVGVSRWFNFF